MYTFKRGYISVFMNSRFYLQLYMFLLLITEREPDLKRDKSEKVFTDPKTEESHPFPSIDDKPSVHMSLVVPAYKEQDRRKHENVVIRTCVALSVECRLSKVMM